MKTLVSIPHHEYPPMVRERVERQLQELLKFYERIVSLRAVLEHDGDEHCVELVANVGHHATLVVESRGELLDTAVEDAIGRMARTLRRHKTKLDDKHRRGRAK